MEASELEGVDRFYAKILHFKMTGLPTNLVGLWAICVYLKTRKII